MILRWSQTARDDLTDILLHIAADDLPTALRFIEGLTAAGEALLDAPRGYPLVEGIRTKDIRRRSYRGYGLYYRVTGERLTILRVLHGARDVYSLLDKNPATD
nr:type II toxin-antitoxin system RelE/ParE family toxin [uncultured Sphingomonas sp.]